MTKPHTDNEALVMGLLLALTALTDEQAQEVAVMTDSIAANMTTDEVETCKAVAITLSMAVALSVSAEEASCHPFLGLTRSKLSATPSKPQSL